MDIINLCAQVSSLNLQRLLNLQTPTTQISLQNKHLSLLS